MRDTFYCVFPFKRETKINNVQEGNSNGIHVSSNGYYGYQPLPQKIQQTESRTEYMDTEQGNGDIQFNNYIAPEDRLIGPQPINRKRAWKDDEPPMVDLKKRREFDTEKQRNTGREILEINKKDYDENLLEQLLAETHGCSMYHWTNHNTD